MGKPKSSSTPPVNPNPDWEDRDISLKALVFFTVVVFAVSIFAFFAMSWMYHSSGPEHPDVVSPLALERDIPAGGPLLQVNPDQELAEHQAAEAEKLSTYGWVDEKAKVVHIPIEQAMKKYIESQKNQ